MKYRVHAAALVGIVCGICATAAILGDLPLKVAILLGFAAFLCFLALIFLPGEQTQAKQDD